VLLTALSSSLVVTSFSSSSSSSIRTGSTTTTTSRWLSRRRRGGATTIRHFTLEEAPGRFMRDEVPDDGMQKYVAWCEITGAGKRERQERRRELQREHVVWQRDCMLPSQKEQLMSELKLPADDADRPDGERGHARILWEKGLISPGGLYVDGMAVCIAAASYEDFEALLHSDPYFAHGVFDSVETFEWMQVNEKELRYDPMQSPHLLLCKDKEGAFETRKATRSAHLDFLRASERVCAAGPLTAINGPHPIGSLVATWGDDSNAVLAWAAEDPYAKAGLFAEVKAPSYIARDVTGLYVLQNPSVPVDLFGLDQAEEAAAAGAEDEDDEDDDEDENAKGGASDGFTGAFLEELEEDEPAPAAGDDDDDDDAAVVGDDLDMDDQDTLLDGVDDGDTSLLEDDADDIDSLVLGDNER
jgi:uncharacterized protein YciI